MKPVPIILLAMMLCSGCGGPKNWLYEYQIKRGERIETKYTKRLVDQGVEDFGVTAWPEDGGMHSPSVDLEFDSSVMTNLPKMDGMKFEFIRLNGVPVVDLSPLKRVSFNHLQINDSPLTDLSPLKGTTVKILQLTRTQVADLSPLRKTNLRVLGITENPIRDLSSLKGVDLEKLWVEDLAIKDLSPLKGMQLRGILFDVKSVEKGMDVLRNMSSLERIGTSSVDSTSLSKFFKRYDAGEYNSP